MSRYNEIMGALQEAVAYEKGELKNVRVDRMQIAEPPTLSAADIKQIRINAEMTQSVFAACIGVTKKAVEAWEGGRSRPDGAARRTLGLFQENPRFADEAGIIAR